MENPPFIADVPIKTANLVLEFSSHVRLPEGNHHISHENPIFKPYPMGIPMGNPHPAIMKPLMIHP